MPSISAHKIETNKIEWIKNNFHIAIRSGYIVSLENKFKKKKIKEERRNSWRHRMTLLRERLLSYLQYALNSIEDAFFDSKCRIYS